MAENHFLVDGAECKCNFAAGTDKLVVSSQSKEYINDSEGSQKLIASTKDIGQPFEKKTFGSCAKTNSTCVPNITEWLDHYSNVTLSNGGKILTKKSKGKCSVSNATCISVIFHGQQAQITEAHFNAIQPETLAILNPLAPAGKPAPKELPKVKNIKLSAAHLSQAAHSKNNTQAKISLVEAGVDESLQFEVEEYINPKKCDKTKTGWKFIKAHSFDGEAITFENAGAIFKMNFDETGQYRVIAFGSDGDQEMIHRCIDINIVPNTIVDVVIVDAGHHARVDKNNVSTILLRRGISTTIEAQYKFAQVKEEDKKRVSAVITDISGSEIARSDKDTISFTPANSAAEYTLQFTMKPMVEGDAPAVITRKLKSQANGVVSVKSPQGERVRPGTTMHFVAEKLTYSTLVDTEPFELEAIKWQLNGVDVGKGGTLVLDGDRYFSKRGNYVVEAYVSTANAYIIKNGKQVGKDEDDDWRFEVADNKISKLEGPTEWIVGKRYDITSIPLMEYKAGLDGPVTWQPADMDTTPLVCESVYATGIGTVKVTAALKGGGAELIAQASYAVATRWCFTDAANTYKHKAGWNENLTALITCKEAAGETVNIHLLEYDRPNDSNYIKDLGNATFEANGDAKITFNTTDIKAALNKLWFEERNGGYYDLYFGILKKADGLQFADMKTKKVDGKEFYFPAKESSQRGKETGKYIYINSEKEIVSVSFKDSSGYPAYKVYGYSEKIDVYIQTKNMAGDELESTIIENIKGGRDHELTATPAKFKVEANEITQRTLNTAADAFKAKDAAAKIMLRVFYYRLYHKGMDKYLYPPQIGDDKMFSPGDVNFYQHIKLSGIADTMNSILKPVATVVLGEELEEEKTNETGKCPRCCTPITLDDIEKICGKSSKDKELREKILEVINNRLYNNKQPTEINKTKIKIDTCLLKAHFIAQAATETGFLGNNLIECSGLKYTEKNIRSDWKGVKLKNGSLKYPKLEDDAYVTKCANDNEELLNYVYGINGAGNKEWGDGWKYRGRGLFQLTGKDLYVNASKVIKEVLPNDYINFETNPDAAGQPMGAVIGAFAEWIFAKCVEAAIANNETSAENVRRKINPKEKKSRIEACKTLFSKAATVFKVNECTINNNVSKGNSNVYSIDYVKGSYVKKMSSANNVYVYEVYNNGNLVQKYEMQKNENGFLAFPEIGINWARFGPRDRGGDNWIEEECAAAFLGFLFDINANGIKEFFYYNDISSNDGHDIGHTTHRTGKDIDIRYPGCDNGEGQRLWTVSRDYWGSEASFDKTMHLIFKIAKRWNFSNNYFHKAPFENTKNKATSVHQDHYHLGYSK